MICSVIIGIFAILTAIAQNFKDKKSDEERLADKNEIIKLQKANNEKLNEINKLQSEIILSNNKLIEANERIENYNKQQLNYQTGADSYGYIDILKILDKNGDDILSFAFNKVGEFPMYNIQVTYWNLEDFKEKRSDGRATVDDLNKYTSVNIGDVFLKANSQPFGETFKISKDGIIKINIHITSKNGSFSEILRISKQGKTICCAYKVNSITDGKSRPKILKEFIAKEFPLDKNGNMEWN